MPKPLTPAAPSRYPLALMAAIALTITDIGLHRHDSRPGVAYLLEGRLTERRGPAYSPVVLQAGEAAFETTGVTHWWRNETSEPVRALVVDIVEASTP